MTATCFIVPPSLSTTLSASATVTDEALVSPSSMFSSVTVDVIPSNAFNSVAVEVTPSNMFSSAAVAVIVVPLSDKASVSNVPSISTLPDTSRVAASNSPLIVKFLIPV